jgi:hypothetical protein
MWYGGQHHFRGGFFWPGLLFMGLFLLLFGKFLFPLLLVGLFIFWMKSLSHRHHWGEHYWGEKFKRGAWYADDKPRRHYSQTADGTWVEIV